MKKAIAAIAAVAILTGCGTYRPPTAKCPEWLEIRPDPTPVVRYEIRSLPELKVMDPDAAIELCESIAYLPPLKGHFVGGYVPPWGKGDPATMIVPEGWGGKPMFDVLGHEFFHHVVGQFHKGTPYEPAVEDSPVIAILEFRDPAPLQYWLSSDGGKSGIDWSGEVPVITCMRGSEPGLDNHLLPNMRVLGKLVWELYQHEAAREVCAK